MDPLARKQQQPKTQPQPATPQNNLGVNVVSPTHFDGQHFQQNPNVGVPTQLYHPDNPEIERLNKELKGKKIANIILFIFMIVFFVAGILGFVLYLGASDDLAATQQDLANKAAIVSALEEASGVSPIESPDQVPTFKTTHGYIYIDSWKIKLQVPDDLTSVSYTLDEKYRPQICFNALETGMQSFPAFADIDQNRAGMGCLTRVATTEGNTDKDTGLSFGEQVLTYEDYNYFYSAPESHYSQTPVEQEREDSVIQKIKTMLTKNLSIYE